MKKLVEFLACNENEYITVTPESLAENYFLITTQDNKGKTIEDDIEIFLDKVGDMLYDKGGAALYRRFQEGILKFTNRF